MAEGGVVGDRCEDASVLAYVPERGGGNKRESPRRAPVQKGPLTAMQIRLTVLGPRPEPSAGRPSAGDVLVTAPAGTALAAVAPGLAAAVGGGDGPTVLYAGRERLDAQRCTLGEPPLTDGAILSLGTPADPGPDAAEGAAQLHVVSGPDAGGVHLLHGGQVRVGRSGQADVPLDDPDVSRLHCAVTLAPDGRVLVVDLGSTNGTMIGTTPVGDRPVPLPPGALLRLGESGLLLTAGAAAAEVLPTSPDGEGHVRVETAERDQEAEGAGGRRGTGFPGRTAAVSGAWTPGGGPSAAPPTARRAQDGARTGPGAAAPDGGGTHPRDAQGRGTREYDPQGRGAHGYGAVGGAGVDAADQAGRTHASFVPGRSGESDPRSTHGGTRQGFGDFTGLGAPRDDQGFPGAATGPARFDDADGPDAHDPRTATGTGTGTAQGVAGSRGPRRRGGFGTWARRLGRPRGDEDVVQDTYDQGDEGDEREGHTGRAEQDRFSSPARAGGAARTADIWPDPAALLLTALGPGPRLWERGPEHPEALALRLGTADGPAAGAGALSAVPLTIGLREAGSLGLAGPRGRLLGLARCVVAQLAALHSPEFLETVLISADRSRSAGERVADWGWLGWLPHLRPTRGQDCRLLLAFDRDQAAARTGELLRAVESRRTGQDWDAADAGDDPGPFSVVVVDGDPGTPALREAVSRLIAHGPAAGVHVICLAEAPPVTAVAPLAAVHEAACETSPVFGGCGAVALLSGEVATEVRLLPTAQGRIAGRGALAMVDAVSAPWAQRFARALAPLRPAGGPGGTHAALPLPHSARLLDELGLARATPASLLTRWADAHDDAEAVGGRASLVLGAGSRGPVGVNLVTEGPHVLVEGPAGSGRTELLRAAAASLAAAERPERLGLVLIDGRDCRYPTGTGTGVPGARAEAPDGLGACLDLPHAGSHLAANDPVRMREFAQGLTAELKRRAELLGLVHFADWHAQGETTGRVVAQRSRGTLAGEAASTVRGAAGASAASAPGGSSVGVSAARGGAAGVAAGGRGASIAPFAPVVPAQGGISAAPGPDPEAPSAAALRLRAGTGPQPAASGAAARDPLPRLVVLVDDVDALLTPPLGSPGRPAAGSVIRALEAVARDGERLGVHLVVATAPGERTSTSEFARCAALRVVLDVPSGRAEDPAPGRGRLTFADGRTVAFQGGRVTGRIPRTATVRPTVVALDWERMGDAPARRSVRELGNGPTDLALLASAIDRAARSSAPRTTP